jgi:uncharacterized repeat protein (TIGR03803 family)
VKQPPSHKLFSFASARVTVLALCAATSIASSAQITTLHSFNGTDGSGPVDSLVQGLDGAFYGTTPSGGNQNAGTVFKITLGGTLTTLYNFCSVGGGGCTDGAGPHAGLVLASDGSFYGVTFNGGASGNGTVFKITSGGTLTTLHSFAGPPAEGASAVGNLIQATDGNLYGTTTQGGAFGHGTVFKITRGGKLTTLHSFAGHPSDGDNPVAALVQAGGSFYGTTNAGGTGSAGVIFRMNAKGSVAILDNFSPPGSSGDGNSPFAALVQATDGNFFGTTVFGGTNLHGTAFRATAGGARTTIYNFCGLANCNDGAFPFGVLVAAADGNLYGTTDGNGVNSGGVVFRLTTAGGLTVLYNFCALTSCADGNHPHAGLVQGTDGNLYGTTDAGGANSLGTVFGLAAGLGPFVETLPAFGKVGMTIYILGTNLTGASGVIFNGTPARFSVVSSSEIKATVPSGATTGSVFVTIPSGTLTSNTQFRVIPKITGFGPTSGPPGTAVTITGSGLTQTTSVTFGGVAATSFIVNSDTQVTANVPTGAKTGKIVVSTPGGTATSSANFTVTL